MEETMLKGAGSIGKQRRVGEEVTQLWAEQATKLKGRPREAALLRCAQAKREHAGFDWQMH